MAKGYAKKQTEDPQNSKQKSVGVIGASNYRTLSSSVVACVDWGFLKLAKKAWKPR